MTSQIKSLRRFTSLASTLDILTKNRLMLLSPDTWEDKNDAALLEVYRKRKKHSRVFALCFTSAAKTFHHWKMFASGTDGICIEFDKKKLIEKVNNSNLDLKHGVMDYKTQDELSETSFKLEEIPFLKRKQYRAEKEYRIVYTGLSEKPFQEIKIDYNCIKTLTLSPWLHTSLIPVVKSMLVQQANFSEDRILTSTLLESNKWHDTVVKNID